jgi:hypothetical protein
MKSERLYSMNKTQQLLNLRKYVLHMLTENKLGLKENTHSLYAKVIVFVFPIK